MYIKTYLYSQNVFANYVNLEIRFVSVWDSHKRDLEKDKTTCIGLYFIKIQYLPCNTLSGAISS